MNSVQLVGRLVRDPEIRVGNKGTSIAIFTVAVKRKFKQENQPDADFIPCVAFGKTSEHIEKYFFKGSMIGLQGRIQTGSYDKDGTKVYTTDIMVENVEFVGSKADGNGNASTNENTKASGNDDFMNIPDGLEEELPFN